MAQIYYVSPTGCDQATGAIDAPLRTISRAAALAQPGDTVRVREGVYREWVKPACGGMHNALRIIYEAMPGEHPVIKGSELIKGWTRLDGTVWRATLDNAMFGDRNPYALPIEGDWLDWPKNPPVHLGEVYLNGRSMYEAFSLEEVRAGQPRDFSYRDPWSGEALRIQDPEATVYKWYAEVDDSHTTLYVNFHGADPNAQTVEINVRPCCFYPEKTGLNYITVRGFEMCHAACPFTPPTADQPGMLGPHWAKGWIIEKNHLHHAKCAAISLGKEISTGHNLYTRFGRKSDYLYQMEAVFLGLQAGWSKENIGGHIVRNNLIHDCGQNGVVGHMGGAFSVIRHNHIYDIGQKRDFYGYEIAAIKLHAAIDTVIEGNLLHDCETGLWLDWQAQGTRVTRNVFFRNDKDLCLEVTHGPCLVDNNLLGSPHAIVDMAQGTAFVHNLVCGYTYNTPVLDRPTPYHFPHSTAAAGCAVVYGGDDRYFNNLFTCDRPIKPDSDHGAGTAVYDRYTAPAEYPRLLAAKGNTDLQKFYDVPQPVWMEGNAYAGAAVPCRHEAAQVADSPSGLHIRIEEDRCVLNLDVSAEVLTRTCTAVTSERLGMPRITEESYENPDESPVDFTRALDGPRTTPQPGPFAQLKKGPQEIILWVADSVPTMPERREPDVLA